MSDIQQSMTVLQIKIPDDGQLGPKHIVRVKVKRKE
jgi:hypothetical protein